MVAIGNVAVGVLAAGGVACGLLTFGGASFGLLFALGGWPRAGPVDWRLGDWIGRGGRRGDRIGLRGRGRRVRSGNHRRPALRSGGGGVCRQWLGAVMLPPNCR